MDIFPVWRTTYYDTVEDSITFRITNDDGEEIYRARAEKRPDEDIMRINLNKPCQNALDSKLGGWNGESDVVVPQNAYMVFHLQFPDGDGWETVYSFAFVNDWSYEDHQGNEYSEPINGHARMGQILPYSYLVTGDSETICYNVISVDEPYISITPSMILFESSGGTLTITVEANCPWRILHYEGKYTFSQTGGGSGTTTVTVTAPENRYFSITTFNFRAQNIKGYDIATLDIYQEGYDRHYFRIEYGDNEEIDLSGGDWIIGYSTNYEKVRYRVSGISTGYTQGGTLILDVPSGSTEAEYTCYFYDPYFGDLLGTAHLKRTAQLDKYFHITFQENGSIYWGVVNESTDSEPTGYTVQYTTDSGITWNNAYGALGSPYEITGNTGDIVHFKATLPGHGIPSGQYYHFYGDTRCNVAGNVMSLEYGSDFTNKKTVANGKQFFNLFRDFTGLCSAGGLLLPATSVTRYTYGSMFENCPNLVSAPAIAATNLEQGSHSNMFKGCASLVKAPALPATVMRELCYAGMFKDCVLLTEPPVLSSTQLAENCYQGMFDGCASLTNPPELPATTLALACYAGMFRGCASLVNPPVLTATTLAEQCYQDMFANCVSIVTAPELPATTLEYSCYNGMFWGCTSLVNPPELQATSVPGSAYRGMFHGCTSLVEAPDLPATRIGSHSYRGMFEGCVRLTKVSDLPATNTVTINSSYCYSSMFKGCVSLVNPPVISLPPLRDWCFAAMFEDCTSLVTAPSLPTSTYKEIGTGAYEEMFKGCTSLINPPELNSERIIGNGCYRGMFENCTSLVTAPEIKFETFSGSTRAYFEAFQRMFKGCTSLVNPPALPITALTDGCYDEMFAGCTSLVTAPLLPAVSLPGFSRCYRRMFAGCTSLRYITCLAEDLGISEVESYNPTYEWLSGVRRAGYFTKAASMESWPTGDSGIPAGWTVLNN